MNNIYESIYDINIFDKHNYLIIIDKAFMNNIITYNTYEQHI